MSVRALVLSGGGAKGAYEAGVVTSLLQSGAPFDIVVGTSIGAFNAALTAQHDLPKLTALWKGIAARNVLQPVPQIQHLEAFLDAFSDWQKLPDIAKISHVPRLLLLWMQVGSKANLITLLGAFDEAPIDALLKQYINFDDIKSTLIVTGTDITTQTTTAFYAPAGAAALSAAAFATAAGGPTAEITAANYARVLEASAAIPAAFAPIQMNLGASPQFFVDGGVANNTPISLAIAAGADDVTVVFVDPKTSPAKSPPPRNLFDIAVACFDIMQQKILDDDFKLAAYTNLALQHPASASPTVQASLAGKRPVTLHFVRPDAALPVGTLEFSDQGKLDTAFDVGVADGKHPKAG